MKIAIVGNSGSGKSTLAGRLAQREPTAILDLDLVFWKPDTNVERPSHERIADVKRFCRENDSWIIEGCYADLIKASFPWTPELIFLDPGREVCLANCLRRPHEPHKYKTDEEQQRHLDFLLKWVDDYYIRDGILSYRFHKMLFDDYEGPKKLINKQLSPTSRWSQCDCLSRQLLRTCRAKQPHGSS